MEIPLSAYSNCDVCGNPVLRIGLYAIKGYEEPREQGGANQIIARERTGPIVGTCCSEDVKNGTVDQMKLPIA